MPILNQLVSNVAAMHIKVKDTPLLKDPRKRQGVASNLTQILTTIAYIKRIDDFEVVKSLILILKDLTNKYSEFLNPRDMSELVAVFAKLYIMAKPSLLNS